MPRTLNDSEINFVESAKIKAYQNNNTFQVACWDALLGLPFTTAPQTELDQALHTQAADPSVHPLELEAYICAGANPNAALTAHGANALMSAAYCAKGQHNHSSNLPAMELLVNYCDPLATAYSGNTALMLATSRSISKEALQEPWMLRFIDQSDINAVNDHGSNALIGAISFGHYEWAESLFAKTDLSIKLKEGKTYLIHVLESHFPHAKYQELLLPISDPNHWTDAGDLALSCAAAKGLTNWVVTLLPLTDLSATNASGETALNRALDAAQSYPKIAQHIAAFAAHQEMKSLNETIPLKDPLLPGPKSRI